MKRGKWRIALILLGVVVLGCGGGLLAMQAQFRTLFGMESAEISQMLEQSGAMLSEVSLEENGAALSDEQLQHMLFPGATPGMRLMLSLLPAFPLSWPLAALGAVLLIVGLLCGKRVRKPRRCKGERTPPTPPIPKTDAWPNGKERDVGCTPAAPIAPATPTTPVTPIAPVAPAILATPAKLAVSGTGLLRQPLSLDSDKEAPSADAELTAPPSNRPAVYHGRHRRKTV